MENQAELKFKTIMDVKKKFNIKIALATKQGNAELAQEHKETQSSEIQKIEAARADASAQAKQDIKLKFNASAKAIVLDAQAFVDGVCNPSHSQPCGNNLLDALKEDEGQQQEEESKTEVMPAQVLNQDDE